MRVLTPAGCSKQMQQPMMRRGEGAAQGVLYNSLNHTQLALLLFSQLSAAVVRHEANDGVVYAIGAWFKYDATLSAVV